MPDLQCPERDPLLSKLMRLLEECSEKTPGVPCVGCQVKTECHKWWRGVSNFSSERHLNDNDYLKYKARFDRIKNRKEVTN